MSYTCKIVHRGEVIDEEEFDTLEDAQFWGNEWLSDNATGAEVLEDAGRAFYDPSEFDYEID